MTPDTEPIRITRGPGGEVEAEGRFDSLAADILRHAGFLFEPALHGHWFRLPFDMGRDWENQHATWAAEILTAARYPVHLAPDLRPGTPKSSTPRTPAMTAQAPPGRRPRR
ncbi:hypothetical protein [Streptomyces cathayae]|uniref:Uncharacterized protein n=1 Tax=Streptomyces cathayae TaxID=3031124 RepID=A0ABY8JWP7_9ACTN|nr:hypothetical protein [Streptomyces sp. HUAS 5]WGD39798.1 hypothetical protein PYS65_06450 [Streptomyces sp. HUAS 5]